MCGNKIAMFANGKSVFFLGLLLYPEGAVPISMGCNGKLVTFFILRVVGCVAVWSGGYGKITKCWWVRVDDS